MALLAACAHDAEAPRFQRLSPEETGLTFVNRLPEAADFNILNYLYYYNGGGVAVGDVDGDGLVDLYFSSNLESNRLYRNLGNYRFEDITAKAGVPGPPGWKTAVAMADLNGDGHIDIHVSAVRHLGMHGRNVLYVNNGDGTFTDRTREMQLAYEGYSTQVAFLDYDGDGDLDLYRLNHATHTERSVGSAADRHRRDARVGDQLLRNDGDRFVDVSADAGIFGGVDFGLGVVVSDLNEDGCPDLYIANDFQEDDFLYLNNCDGTFREALATATGHTSRFSMGVDAADVDNDGLADIVVADMLPDDEAILKTSASSETPNLFQLRLRAGYHPQYPRNTLQLNQGNGRFAEIGFLAGVHATDWSWAPLIADLDNDGHKDLFITNGIFRRPNDLDYINYVGNEAVQRSLARGASAEALALLERMPQIPLASYAFRNAGDLTFHDMASAWGLGDRGFSNGAAYADLNNSGSLDLIVSRINAPAAIYRNHTRARDSTSYLTIALEGEGRNTAGIGARVVVWHGGMMQRQEQSPVRGFQSSVDPRLHFGLGPAQVVDSLVVVWPDRRWQRITGVAVNRTLTLRQADAGGRYEVPRPAAAPVFRDVTAQTTGRVPHVESAFQDYDREPLMPHALSTEGPALAVADVDGNGLDDVFAGGAKWQPAALLLQRPDGTFERSVQPAFAADSLHEDVDAAFFDADGDGDPDLYVVSAGNEFRGDAPALRDRLYINTAGRFVRDTLAVPPSFEQGAVVAPGDFDGDGDIDLFVGSRVIAGMYGLPPRSRLLRNDGGRFVDVTEEIAPKLVRAGMVTSAAWVDIERDGQPELVVVGEWMPVRVFRREHGRFVDATERSGLGGTHGWWYSVTAADVTGDSLADLVVGNLGLNSYVRSSATEPARLYVHDFGATGTLKQILTFFRHGASHPLATRDDLFRLMPWLRGSYPTYADFGARRVEELFSGAELREALVLEARTFTSAVALNRGDGTFALRALPREAQFAPLYAASPDDVDDDGCTDLVIGGNLAAVQPVIGRYDAMPGLLLRGKGDGGFAAARSSASGLAFDGQTRRIRRIRFADGGRGVVIARNNADLLVLRIDNSRRMSSPEPGTTPWSCSPHSTG